MAAPTAPASNGRDDGVLILGGPGLSGADPAVVREGSTYSPDVVMPWWPWLLRGRAPGYLAWRAEGMKLPSLDALAPATRRLVESAHPYLFGDASPWQGRYLSLWTEFPKQRRPAGDRGSSSTGR